MHASLGMSRGRDWAGSLTYRYSNHSGTAIVRKPRQASWAADAANARFPVLDRRRRRDSAETIGSRPSIVNSKSQSLCVCRQSQWFRFRQYSHRRALHYGRRLAIVLGWRLRWRLSCRVISVSTGCRHHGVSLRTLYRVLSSANPLGTVQLP